MGQGFNIQVIVILLLFAFSGLSWLFRKLKEKAEVQRANAERQRHIEEMLRTGRDPLTGAPAGAPVEPMTAAAREQVYTPPAVAGQPDDADTRRQRELADRRREQLRQLRDRLAGKPGPAQPQPVSGELWPGGPVVVIGQAGSPAPQAPASPSRPSQPGGSSTPRQRASSRPAPPPQTAPRPAKKKRPQPEPARPALSAEAMAAIRDKRESDLARRQGAARITAGDTDASRADAVRVRRDDAPLAASSIPQGPDEWRKAIIAAEILAGPVGLRGPAAAGLQM
ncbi:MAG: hypothetical protein JNJ48_08660 [Phycisphaerae bacterium]|nr:hypothetical protein [Phycisphaerae bacterium]